MGFCSVLTAVACTPLEQGGPAGERRSSDVGFLDALEPAVVPVAKELSRGLAMKPQQLDRLVRLPELMWLFSQLGQ